MVLVLTLIAGPMLLFSTINPISRPNPVSSGYLSVYVEVHDIFENTTIRVPLYESTSLTKNLTLTSEQYDAMDFN